PRPLAGAGARLARGGRDGPPAPRPPPAAPPAGRGRGAAGGGGHPRPAATAGRRGRRSSRGGSRPRWSRAPRPDGPRLAAEADEVGPDEIAVAVVGHGGEPVQCGPRSERWRSGGAASRKIVAVAAGSRAVAGPQVRTPPRRRRRV